MNIRTDSPRLGVTRELYSEVCDLQVCSMSLRPADNRVCAFHYEQDCSPVIMRVSKNSPRNEDFMKSPLALLPFVLILSISCAQERSPDVDTNVVADSRTEAPNLPQLTVSPDPVRICDGSRLGEAIVSWKVSDRSAYRVYVGTPPDGKLFAFGQGSGEAKTKKWVKDGTEFYMTKGNDPTAIAILEVRTTTSGCP